MKPATRFLVTGVVAVILLTVAAAWVTLRQVDQRAQIRSLERLKVAATVESDLQSNRISELQLRAAALAQDPAFVDYVTQSLIPNPQLGGAVDSVSISDLLRERRSGYDIAMVLDARGMPAASSGILLKDHASIRDDPLVKAAISQLKPQQGVWVDHGQMLWVAVNPLLRGGALQGVLLAANRVDKSFAVAIARISRTDIALLMQPSPGSEPAPTSGLDGWTDQALSAQSPQLLGVTDQQGKAIQIDDGQHGVTAWVTPLRASGGRAALVALDAGGGAARMDASALPLLLGVLGFGICALLLVLLHWWRTWRPLQRMLDVMENASDGDRNLTIRVEGSAMVCRLRDGINRWLRTGS
jgi:hypothetical protein